MDIIDMNLCKTCKWWGIEGQYDSWRVSQITDPKDPDTFEKMDMPFLVKECGNPKLHRFERTTERDGFCITDGSEYLALLATAEDFGCVKHEAKESL